MTVRTEAEERALVEGFRPAIPAPSSGGMEECKRALYRSLFKVLSWDLDDQLDINDATDKIWRAACEAGWHPATVSVAMDELAVVYRSPSMRRRHVAAYAAGRDMVEDDSGDELPDADGEIEESEAGEDRTSDAKQS